MPNRCSLIATLCLACSISIALAEPLVFNNTNGPPLTTDAQNGFLDRLTRRVFAQANHTLQLVSLPPERGLRNANAGLIDGDLTRIAGIEHSYPNLVMVAEPLLDWRFSAFTRRPASVAVDVSAGWSSLLPYRIGIIKGWKIAETQLASAKQLILVDNVDQLFRLLEKQRVDAVVYSREMGLFYLQQRPALSVSLLEPPLESRPMFMYLHHKHQDLAPRLAGILRHLKSSGEYARLYRSYVPADIAPPQ